MAVVVKGLTASAEAFEALKPRSVAGTQTRILYSYLCTETLEGLSGAAAGWSLCCLWGGDLQRQRKKERVLVWRGHGRVKWQAWGWRKRLELQEKTSSLVTKAAGLRSTVPALSLSLFWLEPAHVLQFFLICHHSRVYTESPGEHPVVWKSVFPSSTFKY